MIKVYLANRPPLVDYLNVEVMEQLPSGEITRIATETGNHWRKIFNVYAKLMYGLAQQQDDPLLPYFTSWQRYRDQVLLQSGSATQLYLGAISIAPVEDSSAVAVVHEDVVHIVMGKAYAERILVNVELNWLDTDFAINRQQKIIVCPYFDYRQLSNSKIEFLASLIISLH